VLEVIATVTGETQDGPAAQTPGADERLQELRRFAWPAREAGVVADVRLARGDTATQILRQADLIGADLIVVGTRSRIPAEMLTLGSVTERVLRKAMCPVLAVPPHAHGTAMPPKTLICATDFSAAASRAVEYAVGLADMADDRLILVHVIDSPAPTVPEIGSGVTRDMSRLEVEARWQLARTLSEVARAIHRPVELVVFGPPAREIVRLADAHFADLIVMGVYGTGAADPSVLGSTAYHVIAAASCPVLTVRFTG
jgi:nucleotide-binding universal stress UspA family protein